MHNTPKPLYNTIVGVLSNFRVSYPNRAITRVKCIVIYSSKKSVKIRAYSEPLIREIAEKRIRWVIDNS